MMKFALTLPILLAAYVSAHGELTRVTIDGKTFSKFDQASIIRVVSSQDPNKGANNPALTCGPNAQPASLSANVNPGASMSIDWRTADDNVWPHNTGPMLTYMANCGQTTCDKFDPANAQWFKIDQKARKQDGNWFQQDLMTGGKDTVTIPQNLAPGNYMVRHEIIALHLATNPGGAEFYPGCFQVTVGGSGTGKPSQDELVQFPGGYGDNDPGIFDPSVFDNNAPYPMPGPALSKLVGTGGSPAAPAPKPASGSGSGAGAGSSPAAGNPAPGSPTAGAPGQAPTKTCKNKNQKRRLAKREASDEDLAEALKVFSQDIATPHRRQHIASRIARRNAFEGSFH